MEPVRDDGAGPAATAASITAVGTPAFVSRPRRTRSCSRLTVREPTDQAATLVAREDRRLGRHDVVEVGHGREQEGLVRGRTARGHRWWRRRHVEAQAAVDEQRERGGTAAEHEKAARGTAETVHHP